MKIVCVANAKGGVGKTTTAVAIADAFGALLRKNVLLIDFDQQASASLLALSADLTTLSRVLQQRKSADAYWEDIALHVLPAPLQDYVTPDVGSIAEARGRLSLLASCERLDVVEQAVLDRIGAASHLPASIVPLAKYHEALQQLAPLLRESLQQFCLSHHQDVVVIDTSAGLRLFSLVGMSVADIVVVPVIPELPSLAPTGAFLRQVQEYETYTGHSFGAIDILLTKVQPGYSTHIAEMQRLLQGAYQPIFRRRCGSLQHHFAQRETIGRATLSPGAATFAEKYGMAANNIRLFSGEIASKLGIDGQTG